MSPTTLKAEGPPTASESQSNLPVVHIKLEDEAKKASVEQEEIKSPPTEMAATEKDQTGDITDLHDLNNDSMVGDLNQLIKDLNTGVAMGKEAPSKLKTTQNSGNSKRDKSVDVAEVAERKRGDSVE